MFLLALLAGAVIGWIAGQNIVGAIVGAVLGVAIAFGAQFVAGTISMRGARQSVPIDLTVTLPESLTVDAYERLPLSVRNAVIVRAIAQATDRPVELVAGVLPELMGRSRISNVASQRTAAMLHTSHDPSRLPRHQVMVVLEGEVNLAARQSLPPSDRVRTVVERNLGGPVTEETMRMAVLTTRFPRMDATVQELADGALDGSCDLAFAVGSIRRVGEYNAREMRKIN